MKEHFLKIRWRLLFGVVSLVATVAFTLPVAATRANLGGRMGEIWPNADAVVAEIWPNVELVDIWPNVAPLTPDLENSTD